MPVPAVKYYGLRVMANVLPSITISANIDQKGMTHDPEETRIYQADPLIHDYATLATCKFIQIVVISFLAKKLVYS